MDALTDKRAGQSGNPNLFFISWPSLKEAPIQEGRQHNFIISKSFKKLLHSFALRAIFIPRFSLACICHLQTFHINVYSNFDRLPKDRSLQNIQLFFSLWTFMNEWRRLYTICFLNCPTPASFCLFSFFSNTNFTEKTVGFSGTRTQIARIEGEHADHYNGPLYSTICYLIWLAKQHVLSQVSQGSKNKQLQRPCHCHRLSVSIANGNEKERKNSLK